VGEVHCLFCTGDARYNELRKRFSQLKGQPAAVIVSIISAGIASTLGIAAGVLAPFVAIILHGIITVGLNSICKASTAGRVAS
jgi:hypothetical protein